MKTYVLDTSVLLSEPKAILHYENNEVVLPLVVIKELESKRNDPTLGYHARTALRLLEELKKDGDLKEGVVINALGGTLRVEINHISKSSLPEVLLKDTSHDTRILAVAASLSLEGKEVVIVSKDLPMRLLASCITSIETEDYYGGSAPDSGYKGMVELQIGKTNLDRLHQLKKIPANRIDLDVSGILPNTGLMLKSSESTSSALALLDGSGAVHLIPQDLEAFGVKGRSAEQRIALSHLLNNDIGIVSMSGPGGTGKSMLALAAGLELVLEKNNHNKIVVFRPLYAVGGQDLGFLPGTEAEKMSPWGAAVIDALNAFTSKNVIDEVINRNIIEVLPLTHIRGRTFTNTVMIIDEAQNLEKNVLLTALSRVGENTRVFMSSDVAQRDNLRVGRHDGIAAVVEKLKGEDLFAHITLSRSERSKVAELVTRLLDEQ
jgi:PhoH-like ATPase